jgi:hypothetical protein
VLRVVRYEFFTITGSNADEDGPGRALGLPMTVRTWDLASFRRKSRGILIAFIDGQLAVLLMDNR